MDHLICNEIECYRKMGEKYKAAVIPVMKVVNAEGEVISDRARAEVEVFGLF